MRVAQCVSVCKFMATNFTRWCHQSSPSQGISIGDEIAGSGDDGVGGGDVSGGGDTEPRRGSDRTATATATASTALPLLRIDHTRLGCDRDCPYHGDGEDHEVRTSTST